MSRSNKLITLMLGGTLTFYICFGLLLGGARGAEPEVVLIGDRVEVDAPVVIGWAPATGPVGAYQVEISREPLVWHVVAYKSEPQIIFNSKLVKRYRESATQMRVRAVNRTDRGPYSEASEWMRLESLDTN